MKNIDNVGVFYEKVFVFSIIGRATLAYDFISQFARRELFVKLMGLRKLFQKAFLIIDKHRIQQDSYGQSSLAFWD